MACGQNVTDPVAVPAARPLNRSATSEALSPREIEVLRLVVAGRSNGQIGEALFISKKTASVHVANIKGKLGAQSRTEIVATAMALGLVEAPEQAPPGLEALILRVLDRNRQQPPASGDPARATPPAAGERAARPAIAVTPSAFYGRTFVGRDAELGQAQQAFDAAASGQGALLMVVGEPGIGKTALSRAARDLCRAARRQGAGRPLLRRGLALAALPRLRRSHAHLRAGARAGRPAVGPRHRRRRCGAHRLGGPRPRPGVELRRAGDPEDDRWRLLQAVTAFLRNAVAVQPLLHRARGPALGRPRHPRPAAACRPQPRRARGC